MQMGRYFKLKTIRDFGPCILGVRGYFVVDGRLIMLFLLVHSKST